MRVLVLEDDSVIGPAITRFLQEAGYAVDLTTTLLAADERLYIDRYDALVLDRSVPDGDAINLLRFHRDQGCDSPALFLTAMDAVGDRVDGLSAGADDYLVKPFAMEELVARVHALTRRRATTTGQTLMLADLVVVVDTMSATRGGVDLKLTIKEFAVLRYLMCNPDRIVSRSELIDHCWDAMAAPMSNVVDVKVAQLRKKLGQPPLLHTVRGAGYQLSEMT